MSVDALALTDLDSKLGGPGIDTGRAQRGVRIRDRRFLKSLRKLRLLRSFEISGAAQPSTELSELLGAQSQLHYAPWGRLPTNKEWAEVDRLTSVFYSQLSEPLKKKFARSAVSPVIAYAPVVLLIVACFSFVATVERLADAQAKIVEAEFINSNKYDLYKQIHKEDAINDNFDKSNSLRRDYFLAQAESPKIDGKKLLMMTNYFDSNVSGIITIFYLSWVISMGCIGAVAFVGMNAISAQDDITFDISNMRLMILRVVLGGLFALVLTLPFGSQGFIDFCYFIGTGAKLDLEAAGNQPFAQILMLTMPFLLGFSTSLVILILNQLVESIQAFFGRRPGAARELEATGPQRPERAAETGSASSSAAMLPPPSIASS